MSKTKVPEKVKIQLWGKAGGRCQYEGCNKPLWIDSLTKVEFNNAYLAHIIADSPDGPRGDEVLSEQLCKDISNLMLMCDPHHRLIDKQDVAGHPVELLREMKRKHESRIELLTSISADKSSHILLYAANIGEQNRFTNWNMAAEAMAPNRYPAEGHAIELSWKNSKYQDHEETFWAIERDHLNRQFETTVRPRLASGDIKHLSLFALAPMPLLIELGRLLSDISLVDVYQPHREPQGWIWQEPPEDYSFIINMPESYNHQPVLLFSLSGKITRDRVVPVIGKDIDVWEITVNDDFMHNDFLRSREQLAEFRRIVRKLMVSIKEKYTPQTALHIFPAMPVSCAIELGRVRMPKADMPWVIYDHSNIHEKFITTFNIGAVKC